MLTRVIKVGGRVQSDAALPEAIASVWKSTNGALCLVHGGGDEISALQRVMGLEPQFIGGRRVTTERDLDVIRMALSGSSNKRLVSTLLDAGVPAVGISGEDGALITAKPVDLERLGHVGSPAGVKTSLLRALLREGYLPVISPVARSVVNGAPLNVNGDDAAAAIAAELSAIDLLFLADVPGVLDDGAVLSTLDADTAQRLIADGRAGGGMAAKLASAIHAAELGVPSVRIGGLDAVTDPTLGTTITLAASLA
jgi:acetylglutamate kinase